MGTKNKQILFINAKKRNGLKKLKKQKEAYRHCCDDIWGTRQSIDVSWNKPNGLLVQRDEAIIYNRKFNSKFLTQIQTIKKN